MDCLGYSQIRKCFDSWVDDSIKSQISPQRTVLGLFSYCSSYPCSCWRLMLLLAIQEAQATIRSSNQPASQPTNIHQPTVHAIPSYIPCHPIPSFHPSMHPGCWYIPIARKLELVETKTDLRTLLGLTRGGPAAGKGGEWWLHRAGVAGSNPKRSR